MNFTRFHIYFWLFFFSFFISLDYLQYPDETFYQRELYMAFLHLSVFYSFLFALVKSKKGTIENWVKSVGLFTLSFGFIMLLNHWRGKIAAKFGYKLHDTFYLLFVDTIRIYCSFAFYAIGYYFLARSNRKEKELRLLSEAKAAQNLTNVQLELENAQLEARNAAMQQHMLELENDFLRAQINPHFLNNTLNALNAKALPLSQELADDVVALAGIMRYSLHTSRGQQLMPLHMEVEHLERVIALYRLRYGNILCLQFIKEGPYEQYSVAPLVLITLVENAMKHGVVNNPVHPVTIRLAATDTHLHFSVHNKVGPPSIDPSHGIGLNNIRKRLSYIYGDRYRLHVAEANGHYEALLEIEHAAAQQT
jgi:sensor histidine kinase YesM